MIKDKKFRELAAMRADNCVSIFIPTYRVGHAQEDKLRLKNALNDARDQLVESGMDKQSAMDYLAEGYQLQDQQDLWTKLSDGLAVFIGADTLAYFVVPIDFTTTVHVGDRYYVSRLLPVLNQDTRFFILALSQQEVRFFDCDQYSITPVKVDDLVPGPIDEALLYDPNESLQMHHGGGPGNQPIYHGQGGGEDHKNAELEEYFRMIDKGLSDILCDEQVPLIIASVEYLAPIYRKISDYGNIVEEVAAGNPENSDPVLLHEKAWSKMKPMFDRKYEENKNGFGEAMAQDRASFSIIDIVPAAMAGRVARLYVDHNYHVWGKYEEDTHTISIHTEKETGDICLINEAAVQTYLQGGKVHLTEREQLPQPTASLNAVYRYGIS